MCSSMSRQSLLGKPFFGSNQHAYTVKEPSAVLTWAVSWHSSQHWLDWLADS